MDKKSTLSIEKNLDKKIFVNLNTRSMLLQLTQILDLAGQGDPLPDGRPDCLAPTRDLGVSGADPGAEDARPARTREVEPGARHRGDAEVGRAVNCEKKGQK